MKSPEEIARDFERNYCTERNPNGLQYIILHSPERNPSADDFALRIQQELTVEAYVNVSDKSTRDSRALVIPYQSRD